MGANATPHLTIVIPTLDRSEALARCLASLKQQTDPSYDLLIRTERGPLAAIRNAGLSQTRTSLVAFLDDDTVCSPTWVSSLLNVFQVRSETVGVTGPAIIPPTSKQHRDLFRYPLLKWGYDRLFLDPDSDLPGRITRAGAFTTAASETTCTYEGYVHYLEACNMAFRTDALKAVGGFDEAYGGIGDWSEPDVCFRLRRRYGDRSLWFSPAVRVEHRCAPGGAMVFRRSDARQRLQNYKLFASRWVPPTWSHWLYQRFLECYYLGQREWQLNR